jgi:hypothetical protein
MLKEAKLTNGIGARIAHNILCISTQDALTLPDHVLASVTSAKQKKATETAQHKARAMYFAIKRVQKSIQSMKRAGFNDVIDYKKTGKMISN